MKTELEYVDELIEKYYQLSPKEYGTSRAMQYGIECAIIDVENTIKAFNKLDGWTKLQVESEIGYYEKVLKILKDK